jgi:hypothetical protein
MFIIEKREITPKSINRRQLNTQWCRDTMKYQVHITTERQISPILVTLKAVGSTWLSRGGLF